MSTNKVEAGYVQAQSDNLPKVDSFMVFDYLDNHSKFTSAEIRWILQRMPAVRKVSHGQMEELMAWMEKRPLFAKGTPVGTIQAKKVMNSLWQQLASRLNGMRDGTAKSPKGWRHYWSNLKCKVKKKDSAMRQHVLHTGRDSSWEFMWNPMEERILNLMGQINDKGNSDGSIYMELEDEIPISPILNENPNLTVGDDKDNESISTASSHTSTPSLKRKYIASMTVDTDDIAGNSLSNTSPPRWAVELENQRIPKKKLRQDYQEQRLDIEKQRLALEKQRLALEKQRLEFEMQRREKERHWRKNVLYAIRKISKGLDY